jgi:hypothetical protein
MTEPRTNGRPVPVRVTCRIYLLDGGRGQPATVAGPGDELLALVRVWPGARPMADDLTIELYRGDALRDRRRLSLPARARPHVVALRLRWGDRAGASSRLTCRALLHGRVVAEDTVLLTGGVDAQGRLAPGAAHTSASSRTRLVCEQALRALLRDPGRLSGEKTGSAGA